MSENPYQSPQHTNVWGDSDSATLDNDPRFDRVADALRQTRPWVRIISVMMFIASGFIVLAGLGLVVFDLAGAGVGQQRGAGMVMGVFYMVVSLIYITPALFLWQYAGRINAFVHQRRVGELAYALEAQKSFWKFMGMLMLIVLLVYAGIFAFVIVATVAGAF